MSSRPNIEGTRRANERRRDQAWLAAAGLSAIAGVTLASAGLITLFIWFLCQWF